jgi:protein BUR2
MTTVERYRPPHPHQLHSDATSHPRLPHSSSNSVVKNIPPACPSPPRLSTRTSPPRNPQPPSEFCRTFDMVGTESSQWLFTDAEILSSPSILDGLDPAEERCRRAKGVNFILQVGMLLKIPQLTLSVASVFFHRFYMRRSLNVEQKPAEALHHYVRFP